MATRDPSAGKQSSGIQACKTLVATNYSMWLAEPDTLAVLKKLIDETLAIAAQARTASPTSGKNNNGFAPVSSPTSSTVSKKNSAAGARHADPANSLSSSSATNRTNSPPPTSPVRTDKRDDHTPSPNPAAPAATSPNAVFMGGVDEMDYPHRAGSPAGGSTSPHTKPVVDPSAPLPTQSSAAAAASANSPRGGHSLGSPRLDTTLDAAMVGGDLAPPPIDTALSLNATHREPSTRFVHSSGAYALTPPSNVRVASVEEIPVFYTKKESCGYQLEADTDEFKELQKILEQNTTFKKNIWVFGDISAKIFKVPIWYKEALFKDIAKRSGVSENTESLTAAQIRKVYKEAYAPLSVSRRLYELICSDPKLEYITLLDLENMVKYLVASHPGLQFLQQPEFQEFYWHTVAIRIMYALERQQCGRIYWRDFDRSDLPEKMSELDAKDVNLVLEYFSYEHFYVLYCKFWELDTDRDVLIGYDDLRNYGQGSILTEVIKRVVGGYGRPLSSGVPGKLDFEDFVYFCLSEEDKNSEPAVLYWFNVLDTDEDGILSGYELTQFFAENQQRFIEFSVAGEDTVAYEDMMCQMLDMLGFDLVKTRKYGLTLGDLRASPSPANYFNMIFNASKFLMFEHRDPFGEHQMKLRPEKTDWDRFARAEYDRMASEAQ